MSKILAQDETAANLNILSVMIKEAQARIEALNEERAQAQARVEELRYSGVGGPGSRRIVDEYDAKLSEANAKCERLKKRYDRYTKLLVNGCSGIEHLIERLSVIKLEDKQLRMNGLSAFSAPVTVQLEYGIITEANVLDALRLCEIKLSVTKVLALADAIVEANAATEVAHASTLDAANAAASSNIETESIPAAEANADGKPSYSSRSVPADNVTLEQGVAHHDVENVEASGAAQGVPDAVCAEVHTAAINRAAHVTDVESDASAAVDASYCITMTSQGSFLPSLTMDTITASETAADAAVGLASLLKARATAQPQASADAFATISELDAALALITDEIDTMRDAFVDRSQGLVQSQVLKVHTIISSVDGHIHDAHAAPAPDCTRSKSEWTSGYDSQPLETVVLEQSASELRLPELYTPQMLSARWTRPHALEQRMLDEAIAAAAAAETMRSHRQQRALKLLEDERKASEQRMTLPILDFINMKVMHTKVSSDAAHSHGCRSRVSDMLQRRRKRLSLSRKKLRESGAARVLQGADEPGVLAFQPSDPAVMMQLFPPLPCRPSVAAHIRGFTAAPTTMGFAGSSDGSSGAAVLAQPQQKKHKHDVLRDMVIALGESSLEQLMQAVVSVFRDRMGLSSELAHAVQRSIVGGVQARVEGWRQPSAAPMAAAASPTATVIIDEVAALCADASVGAAQDTGGTSAVQQNRSSSPNCSIVTPRLFPAFKPIPPLKMHAVQCQDAPSCFDAAASALAIVASSERGAAAALAPLAPSGWLVHQPPVPSTTPCCTGQRAASPAAAPSSFTARSIVAQGPEATVRPTPTDPRASTAGTVPSAAASVASNLPTAHVLQVEEPQLAHTRHTSHGARPPVVPPLDMAAVAVARFKRAQAHDQCAAPPGRGSTQRCVTLFELPDTAIPPPRTARGCSGRKLVGGTPVSKTVARVQQQQIPGDPLSALTCAPLSARQPVTPRYPPPSPAICGTKWSQSRDYTEWLTLAAVRSGQESHSDER